MKDKKVFGRLATTFAAGFFVTAIISSVVGSVLAYGAPDFARLIIDTVNAGLGAVGIRVASAVGVEAVVSLVGGVSALVLANRRRQAA